MKYRLKTLLIVIAVVAMVTWLATRRRTSEEAAEYGRLGGVSAKYLTESPDDVLLWFFDYVNRQPQGVVALADEGTVLSRPDVQALFVDEPPGNVLIAVAQSADAATLVEFDHERIVDSVIAVAMALDQRNFDLKPRLDSLGKEVPVRITVPNIGEFSICYVNDWGNYMVTRITGPGHLIKQYDQAARDDGFEFPNKKK